MKYTPEPTRSGRRNWSVGAPCTQPGSDPAMWDVHGRVAEAVKAQRICKDYCPAAVRAECLERALADEGMAKARNRVGTRGGYGPTARYRIAKQRQRQAAETAEAAA